jgi:hypothetical protein
MQLELRVEQVRHEHIDSYARLSQEEYGTSAAVSQTGHLRWKFIENPQGPSIGVHLYKGEQLVGRMVALARQFSHRGKVYKAGHIVDFLVHPNNRGMPALLQLAQGLKQLSGFDLLLIIAPNQAGAAVWEKFVKMPGHFDLNVAVAPIRPIALLQSTGKIRNWRVAPVLDWPFRRLGDVATKLLNSLSKVTYDLQWPEPEELNRMLSADWADRVIGVRTFDYLNWRYRGSPVFRYQVFFLRQKGNLIGYFVTRQTKYDGVNCFFLVDAFGSPQSTNSAWRTAARFAVSLASERHAEMAMILGNSSFGPLAAANSFPFITVPPRLLPRKTTVYAQWTSSSCFDIRRDNFYMTLGDSDVI